MREVELQLDPNLDFYSDWYMAISQEMFSIALLLGLLLVLQSVRFLTLHFKRTSIKVYQQRLANIFLAILRLKSFFGIFVQSSTSVFRFNFSAKNHHFRHAENPQGRF